MFFTPMILRLNRPPQNRYVECRLIEDVKKNQKRESVTSKNFRKKHVPDSESIGKSLISRSHPSTIDYYWFRIYPNTFVNTFDFVTVNNLYHTRTIGIVQDIDAEDLGYESKVPSLWHDNDTTLSNKREQNDNEYANIAKVAIIGNTGVRRSEGYPYKTMSVNFPVSSGNDVRFSTKDEVLFSLGVPKMETLISAGIMEMSNGRGVLYN